MHEPVGRGIFVLSWELVDGVSVREGVAVYLIGLDENFYVINLL